MGTTVERVYFYAYSNVGSVLRKETSAWHSNTAAKVANAKASHMKISTDYESIKSTRDNIKVNGWLNKLLGRQLALKVQNAIANSRLANTSHTAGLNIGALSLRINEMLIPALSLAYISMIPVIAGLLTIATAAATAMAGLGGVLGFGLYNWHKKFSKGGKGGYGGARRPYTSGAGVNDRSFTDEVFSGFADMLEDNEIRKKIEKATQWTKEIFSVTLPEAFGAFMKEVDMGLLKRYVDMFKNWVVNAGQGLASFGNQLMRIMGGEGLARINSTLSAIAGGIIKTAKWLSDGGFEVLDNFFGVLMDILGELFELGAASLPILTQFIKGIWDSFGTLIDGLTWLFKTMSKHKEIFYYLGLAIGYILQFFTMTRTISLLYRFGKLLRSVWYYFEVIGMRMPKLAYLGRVLQGIFAAITGFLSGLGISSLSDDMANKTMSPHDRIKNTAGSNSEEKEQKVDVKVGIDEDSGNLTAWLENTMDKDVGSNTSTRGRHGRTSGN